MGFVVSKGGLGTGVYQCIPNSPIKIKEAPKKTKYIPNQQKYSYCDSIEMFRYILNPTAKNEVGPSPQYRRDNMMGFDGIKTYNNKVRDSVSMWFSLHFPKMDPKRPMNVDTRTGLGISG